MTLASAPSVATVGIPHLGHVPVGALRQITFQRFDAGVSLSILHQRVQDTLQTLGRTMAEFSTSTRFCTLASLLGRSHFEAFIEKAFFGDECQHPLVVDADDEMCVVQRPNSRKCARASLDTLSGPERFLKHVGPHITYLPIAVSRADLAMYSLSYGGRPLFRCLASRIFFASLCRMVPPATRRKFNCIGLVRKSIFSAARYERTTVDHDIARHLVYLAASDETNHRIN